VSFPKKHCVDFNLRTQPLKQSDLTSHSKTYCLTGSKMFFRNSKNQDESCVGYWQMRL